ncbi:plasmid partitioning protein RepB [Cereibacter sphaeroides]|uniref:plasmid partitioning protein RepB n=1 Tax=Cereibacter sphaeroides TaxID=1063 RepID=UPI001F3E7AC1|nr:plasmid partitioning protein RepB [Cereibacter sphaeroides]MCE6967291.1 plasmid partitioning protein RepB [Cereibacter sphaeroides]
MTAKKSSLRDLAARSRPALLAAANAPGTNRLVELPVHLIHTGGLVDRLEVGEPELVTLAESIKAAGQKVPILVRPHPERPGEYEIVTGRRRLAACRLAGLTVRAEIQDLDARALVLAQAIENIAREDLSYIERARLAARMVDEAGLAVQDVEVAFSCDKTDRSRYLKIGRAVPQDLLERIGKAAGVGRPRWEQLVARLETDPGAEGRARAALAAANVTDGTPSSDERFTLAFEAAGRPAQPKENADKGVPRGTGRPAGDDILLDGAERPVGRMRASRKGLELMFYAHAREGFTDWLALHRNTIVGRLLEEYERERKAGAGTDGEP